MPKIIFVTSQGEKVIKAQEGLSLLEVAHQNNIDIEGACGGCLACSTCHIIIDKEWYDKLEEPEETEKDMLDLAFGLTETSRLACQIIITKELDGLKAYLPTCYYQY